jgi:glycosyltransferase 2 family protein
LSKKTIFTIIKYVLGVGLGALLMWLAIPSNFEDQIAYFKEANYFWVALGLIVAVASHWFRSIRSRLLIEAAGYKSSTWNIFCSIMVGYMVNQALSRVGEVTRATMTAKTEKIPLAVSFGTMVTDRVFDVIALGLLALGVFVFQFNQVMLIMDKAFASGAPASVDEENIPWKLIFGITGAVGLLIVIVFRKRLMRITLFAKGVKFLKEMWVAFKSVTKMKQPWLFAFLTVMIWVCYILMTYLVFFSLKETQSLGFGFAITAFTMGGIGMVLPAPGGFGTYHFAIKMSFSAYAATYFGGNVAQAENVGLSMAFIIHTSQFLMMIAVGIICYLAILPKLKVKIPSVGKKEEAPAVVEN